MRELEHVWDEHTDALLARRDVTASLATVAPVPSILHIPAMTGAVGRQVPERDDVMALDRPQADLKSHNGANMVVTADSGVYQTQTQFLDAFGNVTLTHENGTKITTASARLDTANSAGILVWGKELPGSREKQRRRGISATPQL